MGTVTGLWPGALMSRINQPWTPSDLGSLVVATTVGAGSVAWILNRLLYSRDRIPDVVIVCVAG